MARNITFCNFLCVEEIINVAGLWDAGSSGIRRRPRYATPQDCINAHVKGLDPLTGPSIPIRDDWDKIWRVKSIKRYAIVGIAFYDLSRQKNAANGNDLAWANEFNPRDNAKLANDHLLLAVIATGGGAHFKNLVKNNYWTKGSKDGLYKWNLEGRKIMEDLLALHGLE